MAPWSQYASVVRVKLRPCAYGDPDLVSLPEVLAIKGNQCSTGFCGKLEMLRIGDGAISCINRMDDVMSILSQCSFRIPGYILVQI